MAESFDDLLNRYHKLVMSLIHRYYAGQLGHHAEDLSQEIWMKLYRHFKKNESNIVNFKSYLYRTVQTTMWDAIRKIDPSRDVPLEHEALPSSAPESRWLAQIDIDHLARVLTREEQLMLRAYLKGFNYAETASLLDCSEGRVRNLLTRVKKKMAQAGGT